MFTDKKPPLDDRLLAHYGVKGMKWGVRRDQATLDRAAGRKTSGKKDRTSAIAKTPQAKAGSVEVAAILAFAGLWVASQIGMARRNYKDSGKIDAKKTGDREFKQNPELTGPKTVEELKSSVVKQINPDFPAPGTKMNCRRATVAYEMRRRGNDVKATNSLYATGQGPAGINTIFGTKLGDWDWGENKIGSTRGKDALNKATPQRKAEIIFESLGRHPDGARGELGLAWTMGGGHSIAWEIVNNKPVIFDTQNGETYENVTQFSSFTPILLAAADTRLDNRPIDSEFVKRWVTDV